MKRALRRWQRQCLLARARRYQVFASMSEPDLSYWVSRYRDHLQRCSCWMCGNPRKWYRERTIQERRQAEGREERIIGGQDGEF